MSVNNLLKWRSEVSTLTIGERFLWSSPSPCQICCMSFSKPAVLKLEHVSQSLGTCKIRFQCLGISSPGLPWWLRVKCLPAMQETRSQSRGGEGPLEKEMATHSSILAWKIPWVEEPGGLQSVRSQNLVDYSL